MSRPTFPAAPLRAMVLAALGAAAFATAHAFPALARYQESAASFGLNFATGAVSGGGCTSSDESQTQQFEGLYWRVALRITEDDCGDDELRIVGSALHKSAFTGEPDAPLFSFIFDLMNGNDASHYGNGAHQLAASQTLLHLMSHDFTYGFDVYQAQLDFNVVSSGNFIVDHDINRYSLSLSAMHVDEPASLAAAGLALALAGATTLHGRRRRPGLPSQSAS